MSAKSTVLAFRPGPSSMETRIENARLGMIEASVSADFQDEESQRVMRAAAIAVAGELGRQAARELFASMTGDTKET